MKERILFILPSLCGGGAEKTIANLTFPLSKKYDIYIAVFRDTQIKYSYKGNLIILGNNENKGFIKKIKFSIKTINKIKKIKKKFKINYSISFLATADFINILSKNRTTKNIVSIRNTDSLNHKGNINYFFTKFSSKKANHIVSISEQVKQDLIENFKIKQKNITTIYNPAIKVEFGKEKIKFNDDFFNNPVFINIGRLTKQKGQWHLIRAFSLVVKEYKNAKLLILGEGELHKELERLISIYNLDQNVFLLGFVNNPYDYLLKSKCFVFSSLYEGLGNSILESLVCSVPVISTDCIAGPREILAPKTEWKNKTKNDIDYAEYGILVPGFKNILDINNKDFIKEEIILASAMKKIIENDSLCKKYQKQAYLRSLDFDIEQIAQEWIKVLNKCK